MNHSHQWTSPKNLISYQISIICYNCDVIRRDKIWNYFSNFQYNTFISTSDSQMKKLLRAEICELEIFQLIRLTITKVQVSITWSQPIHKSIFAIVPYFIGIWLLIYHTKFDFIASPPCEGEWSIWLQTRDPSSISVYPEPMEIQQFSRWHILLLNVDVKFDFIWERKVDNLSWDLSHFNHTHNFETMEIQQFTWQNFFFLLNLCGRHNLLRDIKY